MEAGSPLHWLLAIAREKREGRERRGVAAADLREEWQAAGRGGGRRMREEGVRHGRTSGAEGR